MFLAHAGHDHTSELTSTFSSSGFIIGLILVAIAVIVVGALGYDTLKSRKPKSKKKR